MLLRCPAVAAQRELCIWDGAPDMRTKSFYNPDVAAIAKRGFDWLLANAEEDYDATTVIYMSALDDGTVRYTWASAFILRDYLKHAGEDAMRAATAKFIAYFATPEGADSYGEHYVRHLLTQRGLVFESLVHTLIMGAGGEFPMRELPKNDAAAAAVPPSRAGVAAAAAAAAAAAGRGAVAAAAAACAAARAAAPTAVAWRFARAQPYYDLHALRAVERGVYFWPRPDGVVSNWQAATLTYLDAFAVAEDGTLLLFRVAFTDTYQPAVGGAGGAAQAALNQRVRALCPEAAGAAAADHVLVHLVPAARFPFFKPPDGAEAPPNCRQWVVGLPA
ncbi:hypothetical protein JKP88DRAFT_298707 [Tribonema minus]|uniref:Uncharacterized protein n=1 Tax=Tribonema minus TaxID=303371 RepID=A0A835ZK27_9STRA|nr:hypothetical protein JKP88DRAFT_298707 [Tribonema minus]